MRDTIVAIASGEGGAIAIIRVSGINAFDNVKRVVKEKKRFDDAHHRYASMYRIEDDGRVVDEVLILKFGEPKSFTGENVVEIFCHGGKRIIETILEVLIKSGCRHAQRGEFTRRAFENGKKDLVQAEAINAIIQSKQSSMVSSAINTYLGAHQEKIHHWKEKMTTLKSRLESVIEFSEEDDIEESIQTGIVSRETQELLNQIKKQIRIWEKMVSREDGIEVALVGPPNAGKSSIMNALLGYERSIVYERAGTTRDTVAENIHLQGDEIKLVDTAGLCHTEEEIERIGIRKAWEYVRNSTIVLWVSSTEQRILPEEEKLLAERKGKNILAVLNKQDRCKNKSKEEFCLREQIPFIRASALEGIGIESVIDTIKKMVVVLKEEDKESSFIVSARQHAILKRVAQSLENMLDRKDDGEEILAFYFSEALHLLEEFEGYQASDDMLNKIFETFCIGK